MRGDFERITYREAISRGQILSSEKLRRKGFVSLKDIKKLFERLPQAHPYFFERYRINDRQSFIEEFFEIFLEDLAGG